MKNGLCPSYLAKERFESELGKSIAYASKSLNGCPEPRYKLAHEFADGAWSC